MLPDSDENGPTMTPLSRSQDNLMDRTTALPAVQAAQLHGRHHVERRPDARFVAALVPAGPQGAPGRHRKSVADRLRSVVADWAERPAPETPMDRIRAVHAERKA